MIRIRNLCSRHSISSPLTSDSTRSLLAITASNPWFLGRRFNSSTTENNRDEEEALSYSTRKSTIGKNPEVHYPTIYQVRSEMQMYKRSEIIRIVSFRQRFDRHDFSQDQDKRSPELYIIEGKIRSIRKSGKAMYFIDLVQDNKTLQVMASNRLMGLSKDQFDDIHQFFKKGDSIICTGHASVTNVGELTLKLTKPIKMLSPRLTMVPNRLVDKGIINSNRVLNYFANEDSRNPILIKSWVMQSIRNFLVERGFLEVITPTLAGPGTGANAQPFKTRTNAISADDNELQLRVAPELWLKRLIISGFDRIFEIGNNYRNEGIDATHNPEFSTCEFYQSYIGLDDLMKMTENMFSKIHTDLSTRENSNLARTLPSLNLKGDFLKYEFIPTLETKTGKQLPVELNSKNLIEYYSLIGVELPNNLSPPSLLDNLSAIFLESISNEIPNTPIFIYNQPAALSALAKSQKVNYRGFSGETYREYDISLRFELFINGKEYVNSYEEENSPYQQLAKFQLQQQAKSDYNDSESLIPDWNYIRAMEVGLPPTGGWGCGIDRIAMLFSGVDRIDSVLPFGNVRDVKKQ